MEQPTLQASSIILISAAEKASLNNRRNIHRLVRQYWKLLDFLSESLIQILQIHLRLTQNAVCLYYKG